MKSKVDLNSISDGRIYDINDMVKADTGGCQGCSDCCHGVGELVVLTPFDIYEITRSLKTNFDELLIDKLTLQSDKKITLAHLKMQGDTNKCAFLNSENRCGIHMERPNICRLFPLGRFYEDDDFKYFLQEGACSKPKLSKIKVKKWINISNYKANRLFLLEWYKFLKALEFRVKFIHDDDEILWVNEYIIETFYKINTDDGEDFYDIFYKKLKVAKDKLGLI